MRKALISLIVIAGGFIGIYFAYASSATTEDGINFNFINDAGVSAPYTINYVNDQIVMSNKIMIRDNQILSKDSETLVVWEGAMQVMQNALNNYAATTTP